MRTWGSAAVVCALVMVLSACSGGERRTPERSGGLVGSAVTVEELRAFANGRVFFAHQSVGGNILDGIPAAYAVGGVPAPTIVETREQVPAGVIGHTLIGTNGDPTGKIDAFERLLSTELGDQVGVALLKLCYVDVTADTDVDAVFRAYAAAMERIERAHPELELVYTTVPLTTEPSWKRQIKELLQRSTGQDARDNVARERYNALVRDRYGSSGRLFDIARVESTAADGARIAGSRDGSSYFSLAPEWPADSGHLNAAGAQRAATELVAVVARLR